MVVQVWPLWRGQRGGRMRWESLRLQLYSKKASAKLMGSLRSKVAHLGSPHPAGMGLPQTSALHSH